jgi:hypothetical protein
VVARLAVGCVMPPEVERPWRGFLDGPARARRAAGRKVPLAVALTVITGCAGQSAPTPAQLCAIAQIQLAIAQGDRPPERREGRNDRAGFC